MKCIITKIQDSKVWAKSVNPLGEKPIWHQYKSNEINEYTYHEHMKLWRQAESEREELELHKDGYHHWVLHEKHNIYSIIGKMDVYLFVGKEIEVTREGDYFKII